MTNPPTELPVNVAFTLAPAADIGALRAYRTHLLSEALRVDTLIADREAQAQVLGRALLRDDVQPGPTLTLSRPPLALPAPAAAAPAAPATPAATPEPSTELQGNGGRPIRCALTAAGWHELLTSPRGVDEVSLTFGLNISSTRYLRRHALQGNLPISKRYDALYRAIRDGETPEDIAKRLKAPVAWVHTHHNLYMALLKARRDGAALPAAAFRPLDVK